MLLTAWVDFLNLADVVLRVCPAYSIERLTWAGRMLTRKEILKIVAERMKVYKIPMNFTPGRGR